MKYVVIRYNLYCKVPKNNMVCVVKKYTCFRLPCTPATRKMKKNERVKVTLNSTQGSPVAPTEAAIILPLGNEVGHCLNDGQSKLLPDFPDMGSGFVF